MADKPNSYGYGLIVPAANGGELVLKAPSNIESVDVDAIIRLLEVIKKDLQEVEGF